MAQVVDAVEHQGRAKAARLGEHVSAVRVEFQYEVRRLADGTVNLGRLPGEKGVWLLEKARQLPVGRFIDFCHHTRHAADPREQAAGPGRRVETSRPLVDLHERGVPDHVGEHHRDEPTIERHSRGIPFGPLGGTWYRHPMTVSQSTRRAQAGRTWAATNPAASTRL